MSNRSVVRVFEGVLTAVIVLLFLGLVGSALAQVVSRYVFNAPFMWTEEAARYLGVWCTLLTAGILLGRNLHLAIDLFVERLPAAPRQALRVFVYLITAVFAAVLVVYGIALFPRVNTALSPALRIPMGYVYLAVPVGSVILLLYALAGMVRTAAGLRRRGGS